MFSNLEPRCVSPRACFLPFGSLSTFTRSCVVVGALAGAAAAQGQVERVSLSLSGEEPQGASSVASLSGDGRFVAFSSAAPNLIPFDTNGEDDIFVRDRLANALERVSLSTAGVQGNGRSDQPRISDDGRYVVFWSMASGLVPNDTNDFADTRWDGGDIVLRDRQLGTTERVSVTPSGGELRARFASPSISADGRFVAFASDGDLATGAPGTGGVVTRVWVKDRSNASVAVASLDANGGDLAFPRFPVISGNGRAVAFRAVVPLFPGFAVRELFVRDMVAGTTETVSVGPGGMLGNFDTDQAPAISFDGDVVAFQSYAMNLVGGETNLINDVFVRDRAAGTTERMSSSSTGVQGSTGSSMPAISRDGRFVAFTSAAPDFVGDDSNAHGDSFLHDRATGATVRVSVPPDGGQSDGDGAPMGISADGREVLVVSSASNLIPGSTDTNGETDVCTYERFSPTPSVYCSARTDSTGCTPHISSSDTPAARGTAAFTINATSLHNNRRGRLFYSLSPSSAAFEGGVACIGEPLHALPLQFSAGSSSGADCSGTLPSVFNTWIRQGTDVDLVPGTTVYAQFRYDDSGSTSGGPVGLTDAVVFVIAP